MQPMQPLYIKNEHAKTPLERSDLALNIHSPHPQKELKLYQVKAVREFLINAGIDL